MNIVVKASESGEFGRKMSIVILAALPNFLFHKAPFSWESESAA